MFTCVKSGEYIVMMVLLPMKLKYFTFLKDEVTRSKCRTTRIEIKLDTRNSVFFFLPETVFGSINSKFLVEV